MKNIFTLMFLLFATLNIAGAHTITRNTSCITQKFTAEVSAKETQPSKNSVTDMSVTSIDMDDIFVAADIPITVKLRNTGDVSITEFEIEYSVDNGTPVVGSATNIEIAPLKAHIYTFPELWPASVGEHIITITITTVNGEADDNLSNNQLEKEVLVASNSAQRIPLFEHFTNSYCPPCANINSTVFTEDFILSNLHKSTVIRYQARSPYPDPYYIPENGVRSSYYNVTGVPKAFLDGSTIALTATSQLQGALNNQAEEPAFVHIDANHEIDEVAKKIFIEINVTPYISVEGCVMHVSVIEKETTGNTGNNGETEFQHVNMKLYPNANGTSLNLTADEVENFDFTINMNGTNVEEYSDLAVVVFIQNVATKHVLQSTYSNAVGLYTALFTVQKNGEPLVDAKIVTNEQTLYTNATGQASLELENGEYTYTVSKDGYNSSEGSFEILNQPVEISIDMVPTNIAEEIDANLSIYPNPSNGIFTLKTDGIYQLSIFNTVGQAILHRRVDGDSIIDLSRFPKGVYTVLIKNSKSFSSKRIVIK